ncbi:response regulator transcription factor [Conexibacter woesei]|uniref:Two component transcriptional regulator, winged helix family n=1 Tax=Conexibacter woesei (strain DSM 14684 / CCUG 47730 / CIP 108061 / JCM 11494 / NBRC 100937 / ID131577) TaxID=469383 RepID=D3F658_CONWI|nr:response regulator transcription factor [Conexibacter woesei]ADB48731.1 two component transcriptional regulator, winged helix family [Conexibacter woesei DSM 14684]
MAHVLLIEDDDAVRGGLRLGLRRLGHDVAEAATGGDGLRALQVAEPDVVVLDLMLPDLDGFEVCRRIRTGNAVPVIMLTARDADLDVVSGLEAGADDYVVKPVHARVLEARIRAVLRRATPASSASSHPAAFGDLAIDRRALVVSCAGEPVALTATELRLLLELSDVPGLVLSRQQLLESVWGHDYLGDSRLVDACVRRLRAKIESEPADPRYIQTVRGFGYRFGPL